jgi:hypothetical protein
VDVRGGKAAAAEQANAHRPKVVFAAVIDSPTPAILVHDPSDVKSRPCARG